MRQQSPLNHHIHCQWILPSPSSKHLSWPTVASLKILFEKKAFEKQIKELEDQKKIAIGKANLHEKENAKLRKQLQEADAANKLKIKEIIEGAKKSAAKTMLRSKIQMVKQAEYGADIWSSHLREWFKVLVELTGERVQASNEVAVKAGEVEITSKVGAAAGDDRGEEAAAAMGDENKVAKA
ncbi:hypothetical protein R6Q59_024800 [Mikania micrantha]